MKWGYAGKACNTLPNPKSEANQMQVITNQSPGCAVSFTPQNPACSVLCQCRPSPSPTLPASPTRGAPPLALTSTPSSGLQVTTFTLQRLTPRDRNTRGLSTKRSQVKSQPFQWFTTWSLTCHPTSLNFCFLSSKTGRISPATGGKSTGQHVEKDFINFEISWSI